MKAECSRMLCAVTGTLGTFEFAARRRARRLALLLAEVFSMECEEAECPDFFAEAALGFFLEEAVVCPERDSAQTRDRSTTTRRRRRKDNRPDGRMMLTLSL
jgi:hypothetical protein